MSMEIAGLAVIVTGGASGLGGATARHLASLGAKVTIFDLNEESGRAHAHAIGGRFVRVDISEEDSVIAALDAAESFHGVARVFVGCAGVALGAKTVGRDAAPHSLRQFRDTIEVNLIGNFIVSSRFAARLSEIEPLAEERGVIINTASVAAYEGQIGQVAYAASKGGVVAMTLPMARDLASSGIRVVTIAPGVFLTPMAQSLPPEVQQSLASQVPFPTRLGHPDEYASLVAQILENVMLNGETIRLDGAIRMPPR